MDEQVLRTNAALQELKQITDWLTQRCVNHAGDKAVEARRTKALIDQAEKQAEELATLKAKKTKTK